MKLNEDARLALAETHPEWALEGESIQRTFQFADFAGSVGFVVRVERFDCVRKMPLSPRKKTTVRIMRLVINAMPEVCFTSFS